MKLLTPVLLTLVGLAAGVGAGIALKPIAKEERSMTCLEAPTGVADGSTTAQDIAGQDAVLDDCRSEDDPFAPAVAHEKPPAGDLSFVPMDKPFVVPVFSDEKVQAMVVVSLAIEAETDAAHAIEAVKPRLRDSFLNVMFRHANTGGFDGSFTAGRKLKDLKSALLSAAREVLMDIPVEEVLITEIARQDT